MDKYYHFTSFNNFNSIMSNGLIPQNGFRCQTIADKRSGVFLSKGIYNSITMFALMLSYYERWSGNEGDSLINECLNTLNILNQTVYFNCSFDKEKEIKNLNDTIQRINKVKSCGNFMNYIGGDGCFLSIDELYGVDEIQANDCVYSGVIIPDKINVVNIKNIHTNYFNCSLGPVLLYFMHLYPLEKIINLVSKDNKNHIYNLYLKRNYFCGNYNFNDYELEEIPISCYNKEEQYRKTLTKNS